MSNYRWVLYALLTVLVVASLWMSQSGRVPEWERCRESLFQQMFSDACTPRPGLGPEGPRDGPGRPVQPSSRGRDV